MTVHIIQYQPEPDHPDYKTGYAIGKQNANYTSPDDQRWQFGAGVVSDIQFGLGHKQALNDAGWTPDPEFLHRKANQLLEQIRNAPEGTKAEHSLLFRNGDLPRDRTN